MIKKLSSVLGLASLVVVGTPAICYSDSLPGTAAHAEIQSQESCLSFDHTSQFVRNNCNFDLKLHIPFQSRSTGAKNFFASATTDTVCDAILRDFVDTFQTSTNPKTFTAGGRVLLGNRTVASNTVLNYECTLKPQGKLFSVDVP